MKRLIHCAECQRDAHFSNDGEGVRVLSGKLRNLSICDYCGKEILPGDPTLAISMFIVGASVNEGGYFEWEDRYIDRDDVPPPEAEEHPQEN